MGKEEERRYRARSSREPRTRFLDSDLVAIARAARLGHHLRYRRRPLTPQSFDGLGKAFRVGLDPDQVPCPDDGRTAVGTVPCQGVDDECSWGRQPVQKIRSRDGILLPTRAEPALYLA